MDNINISKLNSLFKNATTSYKFFWFLSILEEVDLQEEPEWIHTMDLAKDMVALAWNPLFSEELSLGKNDSLQKIASQIKIILDIPSNMPTADVEAIIRLHLDEPNVKKALSPLLNSVPYRFLSPWISENNDKRMLTRSKEYENGCIYALHDDEDGLWIDIDPEWWEYLRDQYDVLRGFTRWKLIEFLAGKN